MGCLISNDAALSGHRWYFGEDWAMFLPAENSKEIKSGLYWI